MKKVIITFNPDGVVTWEPMPTDAEIPAPYTTPFCLSPRAEKPVKPHQFDKEYRVECTPEQREEIIRVAQELGIEVYEYSLTTALHSPNLFWSKQDGIVGTSYTKIDLPQADWIPFPEFLARLKGEWVEPAQEATKPDYSNLIGKWVKCIFVEKNKKGLNKWFKVVGPSRVFDNYIVIEHEDGVDGFNVKYFDLTDPRDTNPDESIETVHNRNEDE